jgi:hypothetical protein
MAVLAISTADVLGGGNDTTSCCGDLFFELAAICPFPDS